MTLVDRLPARTFALVGTVAPVFPDPLPAARSFINEVDLVIGGAEAITVNGAIVNKIGTAPIALAGHESRTSFVVAAET